MTAGTLHKATIDQLLVEYESAALIHRAASRAGVYKKANPAYRRLAAVVRELRSRGPEAHGALLRLLDDSRVEVRGWAAAHALELAPARAENVLEAIAAGPSSLEELGARMTLREWRGGRMRFP
jgi:hypothetical protein